MDAYPNAHIKVACGPLAAPLFEYAPVDVHVLRKGVLQKHWRQLWTASYKTYWDVIIDLRGSAISYILLGKKKYIWRSQSNPKHRCEQLADLLKLDHVPAPQTFEDTEVFKQAAKKLSGSVLAVAPAANWVGKEWPAQKFTKLLKQLTAKNGLYADAKIALFAAPHEKEKVDQIGVAFDECQVFNLAGTVPLKDISSYFKQCDLFVGNDSGLMHLAAASGIPTVGLFGPSLAHHYHPWGEKTAYVTTEKSYEELMALAHKNCSLMDSLNVASVHKCIKNMVEE